MVNSTNGLSKKRDQTCQRIIQSLKETHGLLTMAAHRAGVSYTTVKRYATEFESVKEAVQEAKISMLDFAEGKLYQKISEGEIASIIFYLKTQGKSRGYIERQEQAVDITTKGESLKPQYIQLPADSVRDAIVILAKTGIPISVNPN